MEINKENLIKHSALFLAGVFFVLWVVFGKSIPVICTDASRLATMDSLVNYSTFEISDSQFIGTCDKIRIPPHGEGGKYISDKPPLLSVWGAGIYFVLKSIGLDFRTDLEIVFRVMTFFFSVLPGFLIFFFLHLYLSGHKVSLENRVWIYVASVFGTLILPYTMVLQNHTICAAFLLGSYVYLENPRKRKWSEALTISGALLGLAVAMDLNAIFFGLSFSLLCIYLHRKQPSLIFTFLINAFIPVFITWLLFYQISGKWVPFVNQPEGYFYDGSPLPRINNIGGYDDKPLGASEYLLYFWQGFLGYKGMFSHSIALVLGFLGLGMWAKKDRSLLPHAITIVATILVLWAFLGFKIPITFGGANFGFRYMAIWMPLVVLFAFKVFEEKGGAAWMKVVILISVVTSGLGMLSPWQIHKFKQLDLDNFDFLLVNDIQSNPYMQYEKTFEPYQDEIKRLKSNLTHDSLMKLAFLYYQAQRPAEALGYLDLINKENPDRECYKGILFSKRGLNLADILQRHVEKCPKEQWAELSQKMGLEK